MIAVLHYGAGVPFHLLEKLQANMQIPLPSSTQWDIMKARAPTFAPVFGYLSKLAAQSDLIHTDDTSVRVLEFMGKRRRDLLNAGKLDDPERTGLFTTGMLGRTPEGQSIAVFASGRRHAGENLAQLLEGRADDLEPPIHVCDALSRNVPVGHTVVEANCNAHARRNIIDETKNFPDECRTILEALREVFKNDKIAQRDRLSDDDRLRLHQRHSGPVLGRLRRWMRQQFRERRIEENSGLGLAIRYILRHWKKLTLFLRRAGVPLTNNIIERALKMAIRYRRNSLFYRNENGAGVGDMYMSLIHTAHLNGVNPVDYLTKLQAHADKVAERPDDWMPWNYRATIDKGTGPPPAPAT